MKMVMKRTKRGDFLMLELIAGEFATL